MNECSLLESGVETEWKVLAVYLDRSYRGSYSRICELSEVGFTTIHVFKE